MLSNYTLFLLLVLFFLFVCLVIIYFLFFHRGPAIPQSSSSNTNNIHQNSDRLTKAEEQLVEIPLQDPVEAGFKPMKSELADSQSAMQLLLLLESAFDESAGKADISKVKEFFGSRAQEQTNKGGWDLLDLNRSIFLLSNEGLMDFLKTKKSLFIDLLDQDHSLLLLSIFNTSECFLYRFYHRDIFDPKIEFESFTEHELKILEQVLIGAVKCRRRKNRIEEKIPFVQSLDMWKDLRLFINNHSSQRRLLSQLCFISFDGLNDLSFQQTFSEFLDRPRASPWITNNRLLMVYHYADQIVSLIVEHQLITRSSLSKLSECSSTIESVMEYSKCLDKINLQKVIPIFFLESAIFSKFPLWPNLEYNYGISFLVLKLLDKISQLPEITNKALPYEGIQGYTEICIFQHFQVKHFSPGLEELLKNFICKNDYTSPDFTFNCEFYSLDWEMCFSPESLFVYPLGEIDKLFNLYSSRIPDIVQIIDTYVSNKTLIFSQAQVDLIRDIANSAKDTLLLVAFEIDQNDFSFQSKANFLLFALLADIIKFNYTKNKYEDERADSDAKFSQLKVNDSYSQLIEYMSFISNKEKYSVYLKLLDEGHLRIVNNK